MGRMRVLVVDDELPVRQLLAMFLGHLGHASETASDAAEALSKIDGAEYDLILTDFNMPGMKGDELAKAIKSRKPSMPVVLVTGLEPLGLSQNFDQILLKPFSMQALSLLLRSSQGDRCGEEGGTREISFNPPRRDWDRSWRPDEMHANLAH